MVVDFLSILFSLCGLNLSLILSGSPAAYNPNALPITLRICSPTGQRTPRASTGQAGRGGHTFVVFPVPRPSLVYEAWKEGASQDASSRGHPGQPFCCVFVAVPLTGGLCDMHLLSACAEPYGTV